jgi:hypothetical protein
MWLMCILENANGKCRERMSSPLSRDLHLRLRSRHQNFYETLRKWTELLEGLSSEVQNTKLK